MAAAIGLIVYVTFGFSVTYCKKSSSTVELRTASFCLNIIKMLFFFTSLFIVSMNIKTPRFTPEQANIYASYYAQVLQNLIDRCKTKRKFLLWDCEDVRDTFGDDFFNAVWRVASVCPSDYEHSYQAAMYTGYLRGMSDVLDIVGRSINQELKETYKEVEELLAGEEDE